jgi:hypothetical protein
MIPGAQGGGRQVYITKDFRLSFSLLGTSGEDNLVELCVYFPSWAQQDVEKYYCLVAGFVPREK